MPRVKFKASPEVRRWLHRRGGKTTVEHGGRSTVKVVEPVILSDGDIVDMTPFEAQWAEKYYPKNFSVVEKPKPKKEVDE